MNKSKSIEFKHIVLTLILLETRLSIGRYTLAEILGISKAKARIILETLNDVQLTNTSSGRSGTYITNKGKSCNNELKKYFQVILMSDPQFFVNSSIPEKLQSHLVLKTSVDITNGLYERDIAVRGGAKGAVSYINEKNKWVYPDSNTPIDREIMYPDYSNKVWIVVFGNSERDILGGIAGLIDYFYFEQITQILEDYGINLK